MKRKVRKLLFSAAAVLAIGVAAYFAFRSCGKPFLHAGRETVYSPVTVSDITPTGQLKVMSVYKEVVVGSTRTDYTLFGPVYRKIYAVYPAQLNLGYDFTGVKYEVVSVVGDSTFVTLPPISILNEDGQYVDETRMRVPIQSGEWNYVEMNALRAKANNEMLVSSLAENCMQEASVQGKAVVEKLLTTLGCRNIVFR